MQHAIAITGLRHSYGSVVALSGIDLTVPRGASLALLGPNGAGKTTLIGILCTLIRPEAGAVSLAGVDLLRRPTAARRNIGVVFQDSSLDDRLTAWENLEFHGLVYGMAPRDRARRIDEVLALVELSDWREAIVRSFSGGMRRRLEIARALMHEPQILFLDEPTVGLDAQTRQRIWHYLDDLRRSRNLTVLITTHYIEEVEGCDRICIIDKGRILAEGSPADLKAAHGRSVIHVIPRDLATGSEILDRHPGAQHMPGDRLVIPAEAAAADALLAAFGSRLREIRIDSPSLESVFLSLTGRELRDRADGAREAEKAGGRKAGRR